MEFLKTSLEGFEPTTRCLEGSRSVQAELQGQIICYSNVARTEREVKISNSAFGSICYLKPHMLLLLAHSGASLTIIYSHC